MTDVEKEEVKRLGGLHIIGTERHESRRIDNQLRGRASRQGDPGSSVFFISFEDDLIRRFAGDKFKKLASFFRLEEDTPIQLKIMSKQIENAQKKIEMQNFAIRKTVLQFDDVLNAQREIIYNQRNRVLDGESVHEEIMNMFPHVVSVFANRCVDAEKPYFDWDYAKINKEVENGLLEKGSSAFSEEVCEGFDIDDFAEKLLSLVKERYEKKIDEDNFNICGARHGCAFRRGLLPRRASERQVEVEKELPKFSLFHLSRI